MSLPTPLRLHGVIHGTLDHHPSDRTTVEGHGFQPCREIDRAERLQPLWRFLRWEYESEPNSHSLDQIKKQRLSAAFYPIS